MCYSACNKQQGPQRLFLFPLLKCLLKKDTLAYSWGASCTLKNYFVIINQSISPIARAQQTSHPAIATRAKTGGSPWGQPQSSLSNLAIRNPSSLFVTAHPPRRVRPPGGVQPRPRCGIPCLTTLYRLATNFRPCSSPTTLRLTEQTLVRHSCTSGSALCKKISVA